MNGVPSTPRNAFSARSLSLRIPRPKMPKTILPVATEETESPNPMSRLIDPLLCYLRFLL